jgi:hypothetical protein
MNKSDIIEQYEGQATYQVTVQGKVDPEFMKKINRLKVTHTETKHKTLSTLTGEIEDQESLNGLLNILFDHRYSVISVMKIDQ